MAFRDKVVPEDAWLGTGVSRETADRVKHEAVELQDDVVLGALQDIQLSDVPSSALEYHPGTLVMMLVAPALPWQRVQAGCQAESLLSRCWFVNQSFHLPAPQPQTDALSQPAAHASVFHTVSTTHPTVLLTSHLRCPSLLTHSATSVAECPVSLQSLPSSLASSSHHRLA